MVSNILVNRYLHKPILNDLETRMVFLGGARQVGKTTFAQSLLRNYHDGHPAYLNWDDAEQRSRILKKDWPKSERLIIFDEIHKNKKWRGLVKGFYDTQKNTHQFLITGSARLDYYRHGGDSLLGRFRYYRMHPFSLPELQYTPSALENLMKFGGFPTPFLKQSERELKRWQLERLEKVVRDDIRDLEHVRELSLIERLAEALPDRVGSPLSINNLSHDLEVDFKTVRNWLIILDALYYSYRISPFGSAKIRAVKKEQKLYLWDWSLIREPGLRFENMVASHLLKYCHYLEDTDGDRMELRFLRDIDKREVDFVVMKDRKPIFAVECKTGENSLSPHIPYFLKRTQIPKFYQVHLGESHRAPLDNVEILPFSTFCKIEKLV